LFARLSNSTCPDLLILLSFPKPCSQRIVVVYVLFFWRQDVGLASSFFSGLVNEESVLLLSCLIGVERMADWWVFKSIFILKVRFSGSTLEVAFADFFIQVIHMLVPYVFPDKLLATESFMANFALVLLVQLLTGTVLNTLLSL
jgi:hypothetical protein